MKQSRTKRRGEVMETNLVAACENLYFSGKRPVVLVKISSLNGIFSNNQASTIIEESILMGTNFCKQE